MKLHPNILFVDDDEESLLSLIRTLKALGLECHLHAAFTKESALKLFQESEPSVVVLDLHLDKTSGVESGFALLRQFLDLSKACRIIVLTGHASVEHGVRALALGAANFIEKPANAQHLAALIRDGIAQSALRNELETYRKKSLEGSSFGIVGVSEATRQLMEEIAYASQSNLPLLITGETGTGKGLCAFSVHSLSKRSKENFVRYQPTFLTPDLVNSELFGHIKGAFTGATETRRGLITDACRGTLFLDEIDELPIETQVSLLGVLQDKKFRPVGSNQEQETEFRLITASNQNLAECVEAGKLRRDLYHRIAHLHINISPLRTRKDDIPPLVSHILSQLFSKEELNVVQVSDDAM
ncbi:MAG: sigma-54-dependent Fis family transcriptional regulator, partial [SAR324 cluster bacterium]|nr:sigma-54-dependent Fis family transcriptional regulator [SAR324 cluster bacterium]